MLNKTFVFKPTSVLLTAFFLAGCKSEDQKQVELLVGSWDCQTLVGPDEDGLSGTATLKVQYLKNKKSNVDMVLSFGLNDQNADINMVGFGTWEIEDGSLVEEIEKLNILSVDIFGQSLTMSELPKDLRNEFEGLVDAYQGMSSMSEIRKLTDGQLELYSPTEGVTVDCMAL